jgi:hypothetical protein
MQPRNATAQCNRAMQPRNATAQCNRAMQPRNKQRKSFRRPQASRSHSANSFNRCQILSAVTGCRATILQPHSTIDGGQAMTAGVPSVVARTHRRLIGLSQPLRSLRQTLPELHQPLQGFIQPFSGITQSLPDAYQSSKDAKNQAITPFLPQNRVFHQFSTSN